MKTTKTVARSPMQMTIVAFVLLFVAITATILVISNVFQMICQ